MRAVAENAGVSLGVVHYCFESKEALVVAMGETLIRQLSEALHVAFDFPPTTVRIRKGYGGSGSSCTPGSTRCGP